MWPFKRKEKLTTAFISGVFYKNETDEPTPFREYAKIGKGGDYETAYDFIKLVCDLHKSAGYKTRFDIVKY